MERDLLGPLAELTEELRRSRALLRQVQAGAREVREGVDDSGTVTVVIDDDGTAREVRVAADWRRRLAVGPVGATGAVVGAAVVAADAAAATRRATATVEALARAEAAGPSTQDDDGPGVAPAPGRHSVAELTAAVFAACDDLDHLVEPPAPVHGSGAGGAVRVSMALGRITGCAVDEHWLARQDDITLAHGLREAVSAAAAAALAARTPYVEAERRLQDVLAGAQALLAELPTGGPR